MTFEKVEAVCPHCNRKNVFEIGCVGKGCMTKLTCKFCSKEWKEALDATSKLAKSGPTSSELVALRAQVLAQFEELSKLVNGLIERRNAAARTARFQPNGVEKSDVVQQELTKALANGKPVTFQAEESTSPRFQTVESVGVGQRVRSGVAFNVEKADKADQELQKALANGKPVGFIPRGN